MSNCVSIALNLEQKTLEFLNGPTTIVVVDVDVVVDDDDGNDDDDVSISNRSE